MGFKLSQCQEALFTVAHVDVTVWLNVVPHVPFQCSFFEILSPPFEDCHAVIFGFCHRCAVH